LNAYWAVAVVADDAVGIVGAVVGVIGDVAGVVSVIVGVVAGVVSVIVGVVAVVVVGGDVAPTVAVAKCSGAFVMSDNGIAIIVDKSNAIFDAEGIP
jgi:hypothetical protein